MYKSGQFTNVQPCSVKRKVLPIFPEHHVWINSQVLVQYLFLPYQIISASVSTYSTWGGTRSQASKKNKQVNKHPLSETTKILLTTKNHAHLQHYIWCNKALQIHSVRIIQNH